jgi:hypothetical protein
MCYNQLIVLLEVQTVIERCKEEGKEHNTCLKTHKQEEIMTRLEIHDQQLGQKRCEKTLFK